MRAREVIMPQRRRKIPPHFSWVDHRLVREGHLQGRSAEALALYLFLVVVADADGLSWYAEETLCRQLSWDASQLQRARAELRQSSLIAYRKPIYQVLDLSPETMVRGTGRPQPSAHEDGEPVAIRTILQQMLGGAR